MKDQRCGLPVTMPTLAVVLLLIITAPLVLLRLALSMKGER